MPTDSEVGSFTIEDSEFFGVGKLIVERDKIIAQDKDVNTIHRFLKIKEYPADLNFDWLPRMLDTVNQPYDLTIDINPLDRYETVQKLDSEIRALKVEAKALELSKRVPPQSLVETIEQLSKTQREIVNGSEKPYKTEIFLRTVSRSTEGNHAIQESKRELSILKGIMQGNGFTAQTASADSIRCLARKCFVIPTISINDEDRITLSSYLAKIFPFGCSTFLSTDLHAKGVWMGYVLPSYQPFFLDFDTQLSYGIFVIGHLGSGKSVFAKTLAIRSNLMGEGVLVISPTREYVDYASQHGVVLTFGYDENEPNAVSINLLGVYGIPLPERKRQIKELLSQMFNLTDFSQILLGEALNQVYQEKGLFNSKSETWTLQPPTTSDLLQVIRRNKTGAEKRNDTMQRTAWQALEIRVKDLTKEGSYPFLDGQGNFDPEMLEHKLVCVNLKPLESPFARKLMGNLLFDIVRGRFGISKNRRSIAIDEAHIWLDSNALVQLVKESRKYNAGVWLITQDLADIKEEQRSLLNDSAVKVIFRIDPTAATEVARTFRLPDYLVEEATKLPRGHALVKLTNIPAWIQVKVVAEHVEATSTLASKMIQPSQPAKAVNATKVTVSRLTGGNTTYEFGPEVENPRHEAIVKEVCKFLDQENISYVCAKTRDADIIFSIGKTKVAIEVETGTHGIAKIQEKIERLSPHFGRLFIFADSPTKYRYSKQVVPKKGVQIVNRRELVDAIRTLKEVNAKR